MPDNYMHNSCTCLLIACFIVCFIVCWFCSELLLEWHEHFLFLSVSYFYPIFCCQRINPHKFLIYRNREMLQKTKLKQNTAGMNFNEYLSSVNLIISVFASKLSSRNIYQIQGNIDLHSAIIIVPEHQPPKLQECLNKKLT